MKEQKGSASEKRRSSLKGLFSDPEGIKDASPDSGRQEAPARPVKPSVSVPAENSSRREKEQSPRLEERVIRKEGNLTETSLTFSLPILDRKRVEVFINNPVAPVRSFSEICRVALAEYLDRNEPILKEMEEQMEKIRSRYNK